MGGPSTESCRIPLQGFKLDMRQFGVDLDNWGHVAVSVNRGEPQGSLWVDIKQVFSRYTHICLFFYKLGGGRFNHNIVGSYIGSTVYHSPLRA